MSITLSQDSPPPLPSTREACAESQQGPSRLAAWAGLITVYIVWGSTYLAILYAIESLPPFLMAGARFLIAGGVLYLFRRLRRDAAPSHLEWRSAAIVGLFMLLGGNGGLVWAEQRVASGVAALLIGTTPLWMVLLDKQRPGWQAGLGVAVGFAGIVILIGPGQVAGQAGSVDLLGAGVVILAALAWSIGSLYSRRAVLPCSPLLGTSMEMLAGGAGLLVLGLLVGEGGRLQLAAVSTHSLLGLAYLIVFGSWVGFTAYTWLLRVAPTPLVSTYAYVNPVVAILLGYVFAAEPLTLRTLLAAAIIVGSVILTTRDRRSQLSQPSRQASSVLKVNQEEACVE